MMMITGPLSKMTAPLVVLVLLLTVVSFSGCGNDRAPPQFSGDIVERLDTAIASGMRYDDLPGVVVGVWVPKEGQYVVARGKANLQTGELRELEDPFRVASITKTFVATAILQLVEEGKLSKSDKLSKWYPDFPNAEQITVEDLLRMRSGIADSFDEEWWEDYEENPLADISADDMIERSASRGASLGHQARGPSIRTSTTSSSERSSRKSAARTSVLTSPKPSSSRWAWRTPSTRPTTTCRVTCTATSGIVPPGI
jgi:CubicO group peptidase (beta-lactamase class C family)